MDTLRNRIMDLLIEQDSTAQELGDILRRPYQNINSTLFDLKREGLVEASGKRPQTHTRGRMAIVYRMTRTRRVAA